MDEQTKLSVSKVAHVLGVSTTSIYKWLDGGGITRPLTVATVRHILDSWRRPIEAAERRLALLIEEMEEAQ